MKCSLFSLSLLHSKQSIFASFLNIFIRLLWSMYEPVSSLSLVGSLWRSPFELQLIFNIGCSFPFSRLTQFKYRSHYNMEQTLQLACSSVHVFSFLLLLSIYMQLSLEHYLSTTTTVKIQQVAMCGNYENPSNDAKGEDKQSGS